MNFFREHLPGCTPLNPCKNCEVAFFLKSRLTPESLATLSEMIEGVKVATMYKEDPVLNEPISTLSLTMRSATCLEDLGINSIGDLVTKTGEELLRCRNLGRKSLNEIKEKLAIKGFELGMKDLA